MDPYKRLCAAIISRAVLDLTKKRHHKIKALSWIKSSKGTDCPQSFAWFCSALRMDPDKTKEKILELNPHL
ncbi:MAG: hypothetical protein GY714_20205 [Desulfobacterales bacterium]|nr:hypothetical protein [Desulfobacterales bacterium]